MRKSLSLLMLVFAVFLFTGCAGVPMESIEKSNKAKEFNAPPKGKSGLYIYRDSIVGGALKKDIWVDGKCVGESAPNVFFYKLVDGDKEHTIATESEFSPNELIVKMKSGFNYFVRQYMKIGVFVGGADLQLVDEEKGKKAVSKLKMAKSGTCSE